MKPFIKTRGKNRLNFLSLLQIPFACGSSWIPLGLGGLLSLNLVAADVSESPAAPINGTLNCWLHLVSSLAPVRTDLTAPITAQPNYRALRHTLRLGSCFAGALKANMETSTASTHGSYQQQCHKTGLSPTTWTPSSSMHRVDDRLIKSEIVIPVRI